MLRLFRLATQYLRLRRIQKKMEELGIPQQLERLRAVPIDIEAELALADADDWIAEIRYETDKLEMARLISERATLRSRHKKATHLDPRMNELRISMLTYENKKGMANG